MTWIAPTEKDTASATPEKRLWDAAQQFRANSGLKSQGYSASLPALEGDLRHSSIVNSYYDDPHDATGRFEFKITQRTART
jgi:hypothetical protein